MRKSLGFLWVLLMFSCANERIVQLPEIENAEVTEVLDISPAYIFYDETQPDSTLFNRKNLIGTTNWLVNVDKRLTLRQAIPHIQYLQNKRRKASIHKNENAKNYFTCNDISIENLGFLEFTDVNFLTDTETFETNEEICQIIFNDLSYVTLSTSLDLNFEFSKENFTSVLNFVHDEYGKSVKFLLFFNNNMSFQDYILVKNTLQQLEITILNDEFFFHL